MSYYRAGLAGSRMSVDDFAGWPLSDAVWVHTSGFTAGLSASCSALVERIVADSTQFGDCTSFDVNYRAALWPSRDAATARCLELGRGCQVLLVGFDEAQELWGSRPPSRSLSCLIPFRTWW